jgi:YD repeat-containing protein
MNYPTTTPARIAIAIASAVALMTVPAAGHTQQNTTHRYAYDAHGNVTQAIDPLGHATTIGYDALHRRIDTTDAAHGVTRYGYDGQDQLIAVTDARTLVTSYRIDGLGNLTQTTSPDTGVTVNTTDDAGNLTTRTDAKGQVATYRYDVLHRIAHIAYADGGTVDYAYDQGPNAIGRLTQITDASGSMALSYDPHGRVVAELRTVGDQQFTTAYRYDSVGRLAGITYPSGRSVDYVRDGMGRIGQIATTRDGTTQILVAQVHYQPFGPAQTITFGNGSVHTRSHDLDGRVTGYTLGGQTHAIDYDAASRITAIHDASAAHNLSIGYDALDRLTSVQSPHGSLGYVYDAVGNRTRQTVDAAGTDTTYGANSNRLIQVTGSQTTTVGMDATPRPYAISPTP